MNQYPCDRGTYNPLTGANSTEDCKPCLSGKFNYSHPPPPHTAPQLQSTVVPRILAPNYSCPPPIPPYSHPPPQSSPLYSHPPEYHPLRDGLPPYTAADFQVQNMFLVILYMTLFTAVFQYHRFSPQVMRVPQRL